jgi:4-hydroxybenzoate polyprenyltransferase
MPVSLAKLIRLPNLPTAIADVLAGYWIVRSFAETEPIKLATAACASGCVYSAGMIWNDFFDAEVDRVERPNRPIPSGRISAQFAFGLALALAVVGCLLGWAVDFATVGVIGLIVVAALCYDVHLKNTVAGPALMGICRTLNVLVGMTAAGGALDAPAATLESLRSLAAAMSLLAVGNGLYVLGVTVFAKHEAAVSPRSTLIAGAIIMIGALLGQISMTSLLGGRSFVGTAVISLLVGCLLVRVVAAVRDPTPGPVQAVIKTSLLGLIPLDAGLAGGFGGPISALIILSLLVPALSLGRRLYST